jgi:hypothetical protein
MTTFTSDDRKAAYDPGLSCVTPSSANGMEEPNLVAEAPYHPGYEDAVIIKEQSSLAKDIDELFKWKERHLKTSAKIIEFMNGGQKWQR